MLVGLFSLALASVSRAQLLNLGTLGGDYSSATAVSDDGTTVVGNARDSAGRQRAFRWTPILGMQDLGTFGGATSSASGVSADGAVIIGNAEDASGQWRSFRWTLSGGMQYLGFFHGGSTLLISADGSTIVGGRYRWTSELGLHEMGAPAGYEFSGTHDISPNGWAVVGTLHRTTAPFGLFPLRWTVADGVMNLGTFSGNQGAGANGTSEDGSVVVGHASQVDPYRALAFRWTAGGGKQSLGTFGGRDSVASDVSDDGSVVVGFACDPTNSFRPFRWTASTGLQDITNSYGTNARVSADGSTVAGHFYPISQPRVFRWTIIGGLQDLGNFGSHSSFVADISSTGTTIVGSSYNLAQQDRAFRWGGDRDGDGLFDAWEEDGIDADGDGTIDLDLPAWGANPDRKDVFVEIDAMAGFEPSSASLAAVKQAFDVAPVIGSSASHTGINLHLVLDEVGLPVSDFGNGMADFEAFKDSYVGTATERGHQNWPQVRKAKLRVFRYCIFAKRYLGTDPRGNPTWGSSGRVNQIPGNYLMVTLGNSNWQQFFNTPFGASRKSDVVAGTLMHELGHTLGLSHGGNDGVQFKPNYFSVMNYLWQCPKSAYSSGWRLDYSRTPYNVLDENSLSEPGGIGGRPGILVPLTDSLGRRRLVHEGGAVDFNGNGTKSQVGVIANINGDALFSTLSTQEDWSRLTYRGYGPGWEEDATYGSTALDELDFDTYDQLGLGGANGTVHLNGYQPSTYGEALTVEVWQGGSRIETLAALIGSEDSFAVTPSISGEVVLKFQLRTGLWKAVPVTLTATPLENLVVNLTNGDCDHDNEISIGDYAMLSAAYGSIPGDANWLANPDVNGDLSVDIADYAILSANYGSSGD